ncbi:ATP-dependent DNA helicase [Trichonephila clavipes]|uniref:ATP-dependent DNA helicase n=1 Tax=Trichonephila clavipes TaxID=2585209 RepID=A0A8X7B9C2_TRICX|nr:ATP-dependent DNA helicase [Trichonephila clavipes]
MRSHFQGDLSAGQFANKLIQIGDGKVPEDPLTGVIIMPCGQIVNSPDELLSKVYPNIQQNFKDQDWFSHGVILASRNNVAEKLNVTIQKQLPGLCNGTRLIVKKLMQHVIQATVLTRWTNGEDVFIPNTDHFLRQHHTIQENTVPFETVFCHANKQVKGPVSWDCWYRLADTMLFSWACSRVAKEENLFVQTPNGTAKNVVYHIALR